MSAPRQIRQFLHDRDYDFGMGIGELQELERLCNETGVEIILARFHAKVATITEAKEVLRLALRGPGDVDPARCFDLVEEAFKQPGKPPELKLLAYTVLSAGYYGAPGDDQGEKKGAAVKARKSRSPKAAPAGAGSTT